MSKFTIKCDMCGMFKAADQTKRIDWGIPTDQLFWLKHPRMEETDNFICHDCLKKIGWSKEKETETTSNKGE